MISFIFYILWGLHVIYAMKNKYNKVVVILTLLFLCLMTFSNTGAEGDAHLYKRAFELGEETDDYLFDSFMQLVRSFGVTSYNTFLFILYWIEVLFVWLGIRKLPVVSLHAFIAVSMMYIFPMLITTIRFSLGLCILFYALSFLVRKNNFVYSCCCAISTGVHMSLFVSFYWLLCSKFKEFQKKNSFVYTVYGTIIITGVVLSLIVYFGKSTIFASIDSVFAFMAYRHGGTYLDGDVASNGGLVFLPCFVLSLYLSYNLQKSNNSVSKNSKCSFCSAYVSEFILITYKINALCSVFLPLVFINLVYCRYLMLPTMLTALSFGSLYRYKIHLQKKYLFYFILLIISWYIPAYFELFSLSADAILKEVINYWNT